MSKTVLLLLFICSFVATAAPPESMRLVVSPEAQTWGLQQRVGSAWRTVLEDAHVRASRADGTDIRWTRMRKAADGRSFQVESEDVTVKVLAQWLDSARLTGAVTILPIVYAKRPGVELSTLRIADAARLRTLSADVVALQNGFQSWDATQVRPLPTDVPVTSWWLTAAHSQWQSAVAGYLSNVLGVNTLTLNRGARGVTLAAESDMRRFAVPRVEGGTPLDPLYLAWGNSPSDMLAEYATGARVFTDIMDPPPTFKPQPVPEGWCSWYGFYGNIAAEDVLRQAAAAKEQFGTKNFRVVQVDDGFEIAAGEWETNGSFPQGHRALTNAIHAQGYKAGVWIAPFAVGERSRLFRERPEWLLRDKDGNPARLWGVNERWGGQLYSLDPSLQPVRAWLRDLFQKMTREWGYDYIKMDFLYFPLDARAVMQGSGTPVENYRKALKAMRLGAGQDAYLLGCGAPIGPTIGLVNGNRIGPDVSTGWPGVINAARNVANRQWMHNVWWQNDPDAMVVRDPLTQGQAEAWTAAVALSGGVTMLSDDLTKLPPERVDLSRMALPVSANGNAPEFGPRIRPGARATGMRVADMWVAREPAKPAADAGDAAAKSLPPSVWRLPSDISPARITVAGLFNWTDIPETSSVTPWSLDVVKKGKRAHVWDIFRAEYLGATTGSLPLEKPAGSVRLLSIAPDVGYPQLLGTDASVTSGAKDVIGVGWNAKYNALKGRSRATAGRPFQIAFTVPKGYTLFRLDVNGGASERRESAEGSALFRITPNKSQVEWIARYTR